MNARIAASFRKLFQHGLPYVMLSNVARLDFDDFVGAMSGLLCAVFIVLTVPYSWETHHLIGRAELWKMKPNAILVNIARGGIVDDAALAQALKEKRIFAAGLDVFEGEPKVHPDLLTVPNVVLTPHIASASIPTRMAMANLAADNLISYFTQGKSVTPLNTVTA